MLPFLVGCGASLSLTPLCAWAARRLGILDRPAARKIHVAPTPLLGGTAIALAQTAGLLAAGVTDRTILSILAGAALLLGTGLYDDRDPRGVGLPWWLRLLVQGAAGAFVIYAGVGARVLPWPWLAAPFALFWLVGITNAFNLLDNMNGLSAGVAAIAGLTLALLGARYAGLGPEQLPSAVSAGALAGACLGFLPFNFRSRIFMGDAGSLFLGFSLAALAALGSWHSPTAPTAVLIPLLLLAYPIFDTTLVVILRIRRGQSPVVGGRDHSSHRLVHLGLGRVESVLLIYLFCISHALTALLVSSVTFRLSLLALAGSASVLFIFGMVLRKAPIGPTGAAEEGPSRGQEAG
ncbi:MAG TPA: MraY family glycosyltransferase [Myxococcales bacterium]|nr:MraY family glycosyltransferase [Myxococcales bacterium]